MRINIAMVACAAIAFCHHPVQSAPELVLAEVAGQQITAADLNAFTQAVGDLHQMGKTGLAVDSLMLEGLIDKMVMLKEIESLGIDVEPAFEAKVALYRRQKVLSAYKSREINRKVSVAEEELLEQQRSSDRHRALRMAGIMHETEEEARQTREEIIAGADFGELAKARSLYKPTRDQGGLESQYRRKDNASGFLSTVYKLKVGEISEPLRYPYEGQRRFVIIKVVDEIPVPLDDVRQHVEPKVYARKQAERAEALADSLKEVYAPEVHMDAVEIVMRERGSMADDMEAIRRLALCTYEGGSITLDEFLQVLPEGERDPKQFDGAAAFVNLLENGVIPQELFIAEAAASGLDQDPKILENVGFYRQDLLLQELRLRNVDRLVTVSEDDARAFYDEHPEVFHTPEKVEVIEILVGTSDEAERIRERLDAGEDAEQLAQDHTIREDMAHHNGHITLAKFSRHSTLYSAAEGLEIGAVFGPIKTHGGSYSLCKITGREMPTLRPYSDEKGRATAFVKIRRHKLAFVDYVRALRKKHGARVFSDALPEIHSF